jgi:hypothetical protein
VLLLLVLLRTALSTRGAYPFHREDVARQAGSCLSCQTVRLCKTQSSRRRPMTQKNLLDRAVFDDRKVGRVKGPLELI